MIEDKLKSLIADIKDAGNQPTEDEVVAIAVAAFNEIMGQYLADALSRLEGLPIDVQSAYAAGLHKAHDDAKREHLPAIILAARSVFSVSEASVEAVARRFIGLKSH